LVIGAADADDLLRALTGSWRPKLERWPGGYTTNLTTVSPEFVIDEY